MAAVANHDLWKDCMRREEKIRNRFKKKTEESRRSTRFKVFTQLMPVYERTTTTIKKEKIYGSPTQQTAYTCHTRNVTAPKVLIKDTPSVTYTPVEIKRDDRLLHFANSCPQMKTCQLPIFQKSSSAANMADKSEVTTSVAYIPVEVKHDHRPSLHLVNSCPQMKTCKLPIFHKSSSAANMADKSEHMVKMKHTCAEKAVVENEYLHPVVLKKRYPTVHKTEVKLEPHLMATIGDQGIPFRERLWLVKE